MFYAHNVFIFGIDLMNWERELLVSGDSLNRFVSWMKLFDDRLAKTCPSLTIELSTVEHWGEFESLCSEGGDWKYLAQLAKTLDHNGLPCVDIEVQAEPRLNVDDDEGPMPYEIAKAQQLGRILEEMGFTVYVAEDSRMRLT